MFDPSEMYPQGFHPTKLNRTRDFKGKARRYTRTQRPPRYYLIDFGLSRQYLSREALDEPIRGGDKSAPEHQNGTWCNPFHTDIYYLGNLVRQEFMQVRVRETGDAQSITTLMKYANRSTMASNLCTTLLPR